METGQGPTLRETTFMVSARQLIVPIQNEGESGKLRVYFNDKLVLDYDVAVAPSREATDWYAFFSIERFAGAEARVMVSNATEKGIELVRQSDMIPGEDTFYRERLRPQFHFTSRAGWLNDPNGLIYYEGEYHMFYQHNPTSLSHGNMSWGHAISRDLVSWTEQPIVLFPDANTGTCFSGAAFIDSRNQLERKSGDEDVIVAFYLRTQIGLCLAYSNDRGQTFTDYERNPVLVHAGARLDTPRPFWYEPTGRWIAPTYDFFDNEKGEKRRCVGFYSSENLVNWTFESRVEQDGWGDELCGCVDFFQLPVDGDYQVLKWVMVLIDGSYIVGDFDGHVFRTLAGKPAVTDDRIRSLVIQGNYYATMTWHNMGTMRRVQIAWMRKKGGFYPGMVVNHQMTIPSELTLHSTKNGPRLRMNPIRELESLRTKTHEWTDVSLSSGEKPWRDLEGDLIDLEIEFEPLPGAVAVFTLRGNEVIYDSEAATLSSCDRQTILEPENSLIRLRILLDRTSVEVYGNDGSVYIPHVVFPSADDHSISAKCIKGQIKANYLRVHELTSSWKRA